MEKLSAYAFPSNSDEFLPPTPPPVCLCQASHSSSRSMTAPAPPVNLASTRPSARQEQGSKRGSASQPPPLLHHKDWTTPKLLKPSRFPPSRLHASVVRPSSPATFSVPVPAAHTQDPALAAQLPLSAQSAQPQHLLPQSLTSPVPSSSSAPQVTFNQLQTLLQPIIDAQLALSARLDKLENPSSAPPAFSSSTPAYTFGPRQRDVSAYQGFYEHLLQKSQMLGTSPISSRGVALRVITLISVFGCWVLCPWDVSASSPSVSDLFSILSSVAGSFAPEMCRHRRPQSATSFLSCPRLLGPSPLRCVGIVALSQRPLFYPVLGCWVLRP
ncbi:UNVERIFIED_CONTAM: hypothetical protein FKN15_027445 [Acipenser sinensis]